VNPGTIYKNRRHHPDKIFVVTKVKSVTIGKRKTYRLYGLQIVQDGGLDDTATYLQEEFSREFTHLMFAP
jgi:hypothetical protein